MNIRSLCLALVGICALPSTGLSMTKRNGNMPLKLRYLPVCIRSPLNHSIRAQVRQLKDHQPGKLQGRSAVEVDLSKGFPEALMGDLYRFLNKFPEHTGTNRFSLIAKDSHTPRGLRQAFDPLIRWIEMLARQIWSTSPYYKPGKQLFLDSADLVINEGDAKPHTDPGFTVTGDLRRVRMKYWPGVAEEEVVKSRNYGPRTNGVEPQVGVLTFFAHDLVHAAHSKAEPGNLLFESNFRVDDQR